MSLTPKIRFIFGRTFHYILSRDFCYQRRTGMSCLRPYSRVTISIGVRKLMELFSTDAKAGLPINLIGNSLLYNFGISCSQGKLKENEDRYDVCNFFPGLNYYAVFDGHRGDFSSEFLKRHLSEILSTSFNRNEELAKFGAKLMENAFDTCERLLEKELLASNFDEKTKGHSGSTALAAIILDQSELLIAQTGDSRAVICHAGKPVCITVDHSPNDEAETDRIEKSGGWIDWDTKLIPYVNGTLSMTRSFGNYLLRSVGVTHVPYVRHIKLDLQNDQFLVLCTDGVSDWMTDEEIVSIVSQFDDPNEAASELTCCARQYGSTDDATAFVIPLTAWESKKDSKAKYTANFLRSNTLKRD